MSAQVELGWNNAELIAGAKRAEGIVRSSAAQMQGAFKGLSSLNIGRVAGIGLAGYSFGQLASSIATATVEADSNKQAMLAVEGSLEGVNKRLAEMRDLARSPGLGFNQVVQADVKLRSVGLSASTSSRAIREVGNALALVGKGKEDLDGVLLAFTQIISKGKVSAEEINQIAERVPQIRKILQDAFGTADTEAIQKLGISVDEFVNGTLDGFSKLQRAQGGLQTAWDNLTDSVTQAGAALGEAIAPEALTFFNDLSASIDANNESFKEAGTAALNFARLLVDVGQIGKQSLDAVGQAVQDGLNGWLRLFGVTDGTLSHFEAQQEAAQGIQKETAAISPELAAAQKKAAALEASYKSLGAQSQKTKTPAAGGGDGKDPFADAQRLIDAQRALSDLRNEAAQDELSMSQRIAAMHAQLKVALEEEQTLRSDPFGGSESRILQAETRRIELQRELNRLTEQHAQMKDREAIKAQELMQKAADFWFGEKKAQQDAQSASASTGDETGRKKIKGFSFTADSSYGLAGRPSGPLAPDRGPLSKGGPLTANGGLDNFFASQSQPSQFDLLQSQKSSLDLLQEKRGKPGDPLLNPAAANRPAENSGWYSQSLDTLKQMLALWQQNLT